MSKRAECTGLGRKCNPKKGESCQGCIVNNYILKLETKIDKIEALPSYIVDDLVLIGVPEIEDKDGKWVKRSDLQAILDKRKGDV